jgi:hypothetical protein
MVLCSIFALFRWSTATAYHLGGICMIIVIRDNGGGREGAYHERLSILPMRLAP